MSEILDIINTIRTAELSQREPLFVEGEKHFQSRMLIYLYELFNKPKNAWNLVSEGLPEDSENVLIQTTSTKYPIRTASLRKSIDRNLYWCDGFGNEIIPITKGIIKVIAWMPLPEAYCTG